MAYDPAAGRLIWTKNVGAYVKENTPITGTLSPGSRVLYVAISRRKFPAVQIAWFFHTGKWPTHPVTTKNGNPRDLRPSNLVLAEPDPLSMSNTARYARRYRRKIKEAKRAARQREYPNIFLREDLNEWFFTDAAQMQREYDIPRREFGPYLSFEQALRAYKKHEDILSLLLLDPPKIEDDEALTLTAGPDGARLADFEITFWYDKRTGYFYWRNASRIGLRADQPAERGTYLQFKSRKYPAHNVVWFMHFGEWPERKAIRHKNGNAKDNRLNNLELRVRT